MKLLLLVCVLIVTVTAEFCSQASDCQLTVCGANFHVYCSRRDNVCSCLPDNWQGYSCQTPSECSTRFGTCNYNDHHWHCVDNVCRCRTYQDGSQQN